ncbi:hypothetical protein DPEC_G00047800 [Dallia pectoralis]|uniref:Uncharacterized protein n=1 Tax=Dallia pectoralis TaxID=75939 RepID=A0ACC2HAW2_DALPE|nr:hypothetical protein DPEC_G00047800 [Dallia pectoralis]
MHYKGLHEAMLPRGVEGGSSYTMNVVLERGLISFSTLDNLFETVRVWRCFKDNTVIKAAAESVWGIGHVPWSLACRCMVCLGVGRPLVKRPCRHCYGLCLATPVKDKSCSPKV